MVTKTLYVVASWNSYNKEFQYLIQGYEPSTDNGYIVIEKREIIFDSIADVELRLRVVESLRGKKAKLIADAYVEGKEIDEMIQEMLALENKSNE